jgi:hypothetical protein
MIQSAAMRLATVLGPVLMLGVACSNAPQKQWMKAGTYTSEEFRRDVAACTRDNTLDDACLEARGWFTVNTPPEVQKRETPAYKSIPRPPAQ